MAISNQVKLITTVLIISFAWRSSHSIGLKLRFRDDRSGLSIVLVSLQSLGSAQSGNSFCLPPLTRSLSLSKWVSPGWPRLLRMRWGCSRSGRTWSRGRSRSQRSWRQRHSIPESFGDYSFSWCFRSRALSASLHSRSRWRQSSRRLQN